MSASLIGRFGSSAFRLSSHSSVDVACGLVLLFGLGAKALPVWDSRMRGTIFGSALPSSDGRSKQTCDLTSSIVPRGTSFHRTVELAFSPIDYDLVLSRCCSLLPAPAKLGAINPDPVHDHGQPARQRHDCLLDPAASGDLHRPGFEPGPVDGAGQQDL